jgi:hypothetical protein
LNESEFINENSEFNVMVDEEGSIVEDYEFDEREFDPEKDGPLPEPPLFADDDVELIKPQQ